jgi:hypothetical protein
VNCWVPPDATVAVVGVTEPSPAIPIPSDGPPEALINGDVGVVALSEHAETTSMSAVASSLPVLECFMHPPVLEKFVPK